MGDDLDHPLVVVPRRFLFRLNGESRAFEIRLLFP